MDSRQILVVAVSIGEDDTTIKESLYTSSSELSLQKSALKYVSDCLGLSGVKIGNPELNDIENNNKVVDFEDEGVYFYTDEFIYKFKFLDEVLEGEEF